MGHTVGFPVQLAIVGTHCWFSGAVYFDWGILLVFRCSVLLLELTAVGFSVLIAVNVKLCVFFCAVYIDWGTLLVFLCK